MEFIVSSDKKHIEVFGSVGKLADRLAEFFFQARTSRTTIALSGGNTPARIFDHLTLFHKNLPWEDMIFYWGDERMVPPDDTESNYLLAKNRLFDRIGIPESNIHRIRGENNAEEEAERYAREIYESLKIAYDIPCFDLVILGLGKDGHTASIFPNRLDLLQDRHICSVVEHPENRQIRITLTGRVINNARKVIFLVTGKNKSGIVSEILKNKDEAANYPAYHINPVHGNLYWLLDEEASSDL